MLESPLPTSTQSTPSLRHDVLSPEALDGATQRAIVDTLRQQISPSSRGVKHFSPGTRGPKQSYSHSSRPDDIRSDHGDRELLVSMAQRLGMVERELLQSKREVIQKVHVQWAIFPIATTVCTTTTE